MGAGMRRSVQSLKSPKQAIKLKMLTQTTTPALPCRVTLGQAVPKKNMDLIVQKATGILRLRPSFRCFPERTVVKIEEDAPKLDRWRGDCAGIMQAMRQQLAADHRSRREKPRRFSAIPASMDLKLIPPRSNRARNR